MRVRVIVSPENASWIIGKMSERLTEELLRAGVQASLAQEPDPSADVNHWMSYAAIQERAGRVATIFITHVDDPYKTAHIARALREWADVGLCMSRDMVHALAAWGVPAERLWYVLPALDHAPAPEPIRIAIATRLYPDGRKRESLLLRLAAERDLSPFHFEIGGAAWDDVVPKLREAGASVHWLPGTADYQADYRALIDAMRTCRYYLYLGMDEGSLGTLDALALGLEPIVTPQGFHLEFAEGVIRAVESYEDLANAMDSLAADRAHRVDSVKGWTWEQYAADHLLVWEALLAGQRDLASALQGKGRYVDAASQPAGAGLARRTWSGYYRGLFSPSRLLDGLTRLPLVQPLRRLKRRLSK